MKKILALLIVVFMLLPFVVACGKDETTTAAPENDDVTTTDNDGTTTDDNGGSTTKKQSSGEKIDSKNKISTAWSGKTVNVLATGWGGDGADTSTATLSAPWSQIELCVKSYSETSDFGATMDEAVLDRAAFIKSTYGVDLNWIVATGFQMIGDDLNTALLSESVTYDIAMPRGVETQQLVTSGQVYDMSERLDFSREDFGKAVNEIFTVFGHTFFTAGDFNNLDEETSLLLFFNKDMDGGPDAAELYGMVKDGEWTMDALMSIAKVVKFNSDGLPEQTDYDTYGLSITDFAKFFQYSGIMEAEVNQETGFYEISLQQDITNSVVDKIIEFQNGTDWCRTGWEGDGWGKNALDAFKDGRLLFYNEVVEKFRHLSDATISVGVVPFPKFNEEQDRYYAPCITYQCPVMCIPTCTSDRDMSEYFVDVLSWTGSEYIMDAYYEMIRGSLEGEDDLEILQDYVLANTKMDVGDTSGWEGFLGSVKSGCFKDGTNSFETLMTDESATAQAKLDTWNDSWQNYIEME